MAYPVDAFIQARKYQADQKAQPNPILSGLGTGIGAGIQTGATNAFAEQSKMKERRGELFKDFLQKNILFDTQTQQPLEMNQLMAEYGNFVNQGTISPNIKVKRLNAFDLNQATQVPEGMDVVGYDQRGQPMLRKVKPTIEPDLEMEAYKKTKGAEKAKKELGVSPIDEMEQYNQKLLLKQKPKAKSELIKNITEADNLERKLTEAYDAAQGIPTGILGSLSIKGKEFIGSKDPMLRNVQKVANALASLQLNQLQFTKGAVSDAEMKFFANSVANGDVKVLPRMLQSIESGISDIKARKQGALNTYQSTFSEDPYSFLKTSQNNVITPEVMPQGSKLPMQQQPSNIQNLKSKYGLE